MTCHRGLHRRTDALHLRAPRRATSRGPRATLWQRRKRERDLAALGVVRQQRSINEKHGISSTAFCVAQAQPPRSRHLHVRALAESRVTSGTAARADSASQAARARRSFSTRSGPGCSCKHRSSHRGPAARRARARGGAGPCRGVSEAIISFIVSSSRVSAGEGGSELASKPFHFTSKLRYVSSRHRLRVTSRHVPSRQWWKSAALRSCVRIRRACSSKRPMQLTILSRATRSVGARP